MKNIHRLRRVLSVCNWAAAAIAISLSPASAAPETRTCTNYGPDATGWNNTDEILFHIGAAKQLIDAGASSVVIHLSAGVWGFRGTKGNGDEVVEPVALKYSGTKIPRHTEHIPIQGAKNITIQGAALDGNGNPTTRIQFRDFNKSGFGVYNSLNIQFKDLYIEYAPRPFTQGKVVGVGTGTDKYVDIRIDADYPDPVGDLYDPTENSAQRDKNSHILFFDKDTRRLDPFVSDGLLYDRSTNSAGVFQPQQGQGDSWRFSFNSSKSRGGSDDMSDIKVDQLAAIVPRYLGRAVYLNNSFSCTFNNVRFRSSPGAALIQEAGGGQTTLTDCKIVPISSNDLISVNTDGFNFQNCNPGPIIQNCDLRRGGDNLIAISAKSQTVADITPDRKKFTISQALAAQDYDVGQAVRFYGTSGPLLGNGTIGSITAPNNQTYEITLAGSGTVPPDTATVKSVTSMCQGFLVENNVLSDSRGSQIAVNAWSGTIKTNTLSRGTCHGIYVIHNDGILAVAGKAISINGNTLEDFQQGSSIAVISSICNRGSYYRDHPEADQYPIRNINIVGNTIRGASREMPAILADNILDALIQNNTFESFMPPENRDKLFIRGQWLAMVNDLEPHQAKEDVCITLDRVTNTTLGGNTVGPNVPVDVSRFRLTPNVATGTNNTINWQP